MVSDLAVLDNRTDAASWPQVDAIPGLLRLCIVHNHIFAAPLMAVLRRTWTDTRARARLLPVQVEFINDQLDMGPCGTPMI
jgi:hypothetical protein